MAEETFDPADADSTALWRGLTAIADVEAEFSERFYALFFRRRPDTRELFGAHPIAEQEEMMRETLRSLSALGDSNGAEAPWLRENLEALGDSHAEYGVTPDMYESFRAVMIECARETLGSGLDEAGVSALDEAIGRVCDLMNPAHRDESPSSPL